MTLGNEVLGLALMPENVSNTDGSLRQRPDLLAAVAHLHATDSGIAAARSAFLCKLSASLNVQGNFGQISVDGLYYERMTHPQTGLFLHFDWPLYQGGLLENRLRAAQSEQAVADTLLESRNQALRQVALAYDQLDTGLQQYDAAVALNTTAEASFSSASDSYAHGVGTLTDAMSAAAALSAARADAARAHAQSLVNAAALAFATGGMGIGHNRPVSRNRCTRCPSTISAVSSR